MTDTNADRGRLTARYLEILSRAAERGHDSFGIVAMDAEGRVQRRVDIAPQHFDWASGIITPTCNIVIASNRAEPTTEFVPKKSHHDVQPFGSDGVYVSHNGTIANDRDLRERFGLITHTLIDSAILPPLIRQIGIHTALEEIQGSFALAAIDASEPNKLWLARNYNPLYLQHDQDLGAILFASHPDHLLGTVDFMERLNRPTVLDIPAHHMMQIDTTGRVISYDLAPRGADRRALIICSGGLDSTTAARWAQLEGYDIALLHFAYRCRAQEREIVAVQAIASSLRCPYFIEDLGWLGELGGSSLTDSSIRIRHNVESAEFAHEWVPARNMVFIALAAALCDRHGYDTIVLGLNLEESGAYADNTVEFYELLDRVCNVGTMRRPRIVCPLGTLVKHEIVRLALDIGAPVHLSWSCYHGGESQCGHCGPCFMRRTAFRMIGVGDSIRYEHEAPPADAVRIAISRESGGM